MVEMRPCRAAAILFVATLVVSYVLLQGPAASALDAVGFLTRTVSVDGRYSIRCAIWYPAGGGTAGVVYDFGRATRAGKAFTDARPDAAHGPYPVVVYSHGYSGCSVASAYLCEALAAAGFVVVAPDHTDNPKVCSLTPGFRQEPFSGFLILANAMELAKGFASGDYSLEDYRYRFSEIAAAIDGIRREGKDPRSPLYSLIDEGHIGAVGHSLGGFSVMAAAGVSDIGVDIPLDAVVSLSGPGGIVFSCDYLGRVTIPVMLMYGKKEENKRKKGAGLLSQYRCLAGPRFLMGLVGGDHLAFSEGLFFDAYSDDKERRDAAARHDLICRYVTAFFERYLKGRREGEKILKQKDAGLDPYYFSDHP